MVQYVENLLDQQPSDLDNSRVRPKFYPQNVTPKIVGAEIVNKGNQNVSVPYPGVQWFQDVPGEMTNLLHGKVTQAPHLLAIGITAATGAAMGGLFLLVRVPVRACRARCSRAAASGSMEEGLLA